MGGDCGTWNQLAEERRYLSLIHSLMSFGGCHGMGAEFSDALISHFSKFLGERFFRTKSEERFGEL